MARGGYTTRPFDSGGPYGDTAGSPPPFHAGQNFEGEPEDADLSQYEGTDDTLRTEGWVGTRQWQGGGSGYQGRDVTDPSTWQVPGDEYAESGGMFNRLAQEAYGGGSRPGTG